LALARHLSPELSTWGKAAAALGLPREVESNAHRISSHLRQNHTGMQLERFLNELSASLDALAEPIDYAQRREALANLEDLDAEEWHALVLGSGRHRVNRYWLERRQPAAAWVWVTATEGDFHLAPSLRTYELPPRTRRLAENRYRQYFVRNALPQIEDGLTRHAEAFLRHRSLSGPLVQDPPFVSQK
jgi:hypothetical protein